MKTIEHLTIPAEPGWVVVSIDRWDIPEDKDGPALKGVACWIDPLVGWLVHGELPYPDREDGERWRELIPNTNIRTWRSNHRDWEGEPLAAVVERDSVTLCTPPGTVWAGPRSGLSEEHATLALETPREAERPW